MSFLTDILKWLAVWYAPAEEDRAWMQRAQSQCQGDVEVTVAVLDSAESRRLFDVPMARRGIQPVWIKIVNRADRAYRLDLVSVDPNYYTPLEASAANHFSTGKRLVAFGLLAWMFLPLILLLPLKLIGAIFASRKMDAYFRRVAIPLRPIDRGAESSGFVFTTFDTGIKVVRVRLLGPDDEKEYTFTATVPGLNADYARRDFQTRYAAAQLVECDDQAFHQQVLQSPRATSDRRATREGDPVNLVVVGEFPVILAAFGARWNETEAITLATCWKTLRSFLLGAQYRYSPVSPLYLYGRSQDFALQRIRHSINDRLHLRLWATPLRLQGQPVWVGQVSRDIGVRFTFKTWNLTTHRVDPDVDEARDYVLQDLLEGERIGLAGYVDGAGACDPSQPRKNLTGDPYFTDGKRAIVVLSASRTKPRFAWS